MQTDRRYGGGLRGSARQKFRRYGMFTMEALTPQMDVPANHVSVIEAARILGIVGSSMHHYVQRGLIPAVKVATPPRSTGLPYRYFVSRGDVEKFRTYVRVPLWGEMNTRDAARKMGIGPSTLKNWARDRKVTPDRIVQTGRRKFFFWKQKTVDELSGRIAQRPPGDEIFMDDVCAMLSLNKDRVYRLVQENILHAQWMRDGSRNRLLFFKSEVEALKAWYMRMITSGPGWRLFLKKAKTRRDAHKYRGLRRLKP